MKGLPNYADGSHLKLRQHVCSGCAQSSWHQQHCLLGSRLINCWAIRTIFAAVFVYVEIILLRQCLFDKERCTFGPLPRLTTCMERPSTETLTLFREEDMCLRWRRDTVGKQMQKGEDDIFLHISSILFRPQISKLTQKCKSRCDFRFAIWYWNGGWGV